MEGKLFKETNLTFGEVKEDAVINFEFELKEGVDVDQIEYHKVDCGACTKARLEGNKIIGQVDVSKAVYNLQQEKTPVTKFVHVYINDGRPSWVGKEGTKEGIFNKEKETERLFINFVVLKS